MASPVLSEGRESQRAWTPRPQAQGPGWPRDWGALENEDWPYGDNRFAEQVARNICRRDVAVE